MPRICTESLRLATVWPLPALLGWLLAWAAFSALRAANLPEPLVFTAAAAIGAVFSLIGNTACRRLIIAGAFPISMLAGGAADGVPAIAWLAPLVLLALAYPLKAWRDAPLFPTPSHALQGLEHVAALPPGARVLDAGCGLGHALRELRRAYRAYPRSRIEGIEWSWPLALLARLRCPWAVVRRGNMWSRDWSGCDLVYLFQRPESMPRAVAKAQRELAPGAWLASLEFEAKPLTPQAVLTCRDGRPLWLYRMQVKGA